MKYLKAFGLCLVTITGAAVIGTHTCDLSGTCYAGDGEQPACCVRVDVLGSRGGEHGTGTLVRPDLVLTAHHVIRDSRPGDRIRVTFRDGFERDASVVKVDRTQDLAALAIEPVIYPAARPAKRSVIKDQDVVICGFPKAGDYDEVRGRVVGFASPTRNSEDTLFTVSERAESGMSGGPVFNMNGDLVGVLFGSLRYANCTGLDAIKAFLRSVK
jgi:S1-C subfamily serine protease